MFKRLFVIAMALLLVGALAVPAAAGSGDNPVVVFNEADDSHRVGSGTVVTIASSDTVDSENVALARASCTDCRTVAVAVQAVIITTNASTVTPKNAAVATNSDCTRCETGAFAYQYVVSPRVPVYLSDEGRAEIKRLRRQIAATAASGASFETMDAELDPLVDRFKDVIDKEIIAAGGRSGGTLYESADAA